MKIATYNLRHGGKAKVHWSRLLDDFSVDLLLVQESYHPEEHLLPLLRPEAKRSSVWEKLPNDKIKWGSGIYSTSGKLTPITVPGFVGSVVGAELDCPNWLAGPDTSILVFSIHAPTNKISYVRNVNFILDEISKIASDRPIILGGDFNLTITKHRPSDAKKTKASEKNIHARLREEFGLFNCWDFTNPDIPLTQTLRWSMDRSNAYHCDGIFFPNSWADHIESCKVLQGDDWTALSDHNPIIAEFSSS